MSWVTEALQFVWTNFLLLGPLLLVGLLIAGLIHVLISRRAVLRFLRKDSLGSVSISAAAGVPIPLCSCSVVPVVAEMRRKGASRSACMSFLITAPETGADSILVTHAYFGPVVAAIRPILSFVTAVVAGVISIAHPYRDSPAARALQGEAAPDAMSSESLVDGDCCEGDHAHKPLIAGNDDCYVPPAVLKASLANGTRSLLSRVRSASTYVRSRRARTEPNPAGETESQVEFWRDAESSTEQHPSFREIVRHCLRYGFVEVADDILFALLVGVVIGALIYLAIPSDLLDYEHARWVSYPVMALVAVPLYICASASTPIAAALVAKGFSPGSALIFLMTGPATNTGTIALILSQFGKAFATIYVGVVVGVTVVFGILIDTVLLWAGVGIVVNFSESVSTPIQAIQWIGALALIALMLWRFQSGAFVRGYRDFVSNFR